VTLVIVSTLVLSSTLVLVCTLVKRFTLVECTYVKTVTYRETRSTLVRVLTVTLVLSSMLVTVFTRVGAPTSGVGEASTVMAAGGPPTPFPKPLWVVVPTPTLLTMLFPALSEGPTIAWGIFSTPFPVSMVLESATVPT
jgi:hypothetical protein